MKLTISLKNAPTDNRRLTLCRGRLKSSVAYRDWKENEIGDLSKFVEYNYNKKQFKPTFQNQLPYTVKIYMKDKRTDQANWDKGIRDIITQAGVWDDDKWAYPIYTPCEIDALNPRAEIIIE